MADVLRLSKEVKFQYAEAVGPHSLRRGMAQDLIDQRCTLATLLKAGGWSSSAYQLYLRTEQVKDTAVGHFLVELADSDAE